MLKLMKYDFRRHYKPFAVVIAINLFLIVSRGLGLKSEGLYNTYNGAFGLIQVIFIIYACIEIYRDFCSADSILVQQLPTDIRVRFISKILVFSILYVAYQCSRLMADLACKESAYNTLKVYVKNYREYIIYDFSGAILYFMSTVAVVAFGLILVNSILRNKNITFFLNIFMVFLLFWSSIMIYQKNFHYMGSNIFEIFEYKKDVPDKDKSIELRAGYMPFNYYKTSSDLNPSHYRNTHEKTSIGGQMKNSLLYCIAWMMISIIVTIVLIRWRGINM